MSKPRNPKSKSPKKRPKAKSGTPFELRARDAIQFINREKIAGHDEDLEMRYGRKRQFDVTLRDGADHTLDAVYEAKDYTRRVEFRHVEAFETKVRELADPPKRGGLVSAHGFQEGPLERGKKLGDELLSARASFRGFLTSSSKIDPPASSSPSRAVTT